MHHQYGETEDIMERVCIFSKERSNMDMDQLMQEQRSEVKAIYPLDTALALIATHHTPDQAHSIQFSLFGESQTGLLLTSYNGHQKYFYY